MTYRGRVGKFLLALCALTAIVSCAQRSPKSADANIPGQFQYDGKLYLLSRNEPGVIQDNSVRTSDADGRTFNYGDQSLLRHLWSGYWENFSALPAGEQKEVAGVAVAALEFLRNGEANSGSLSPMDQRHRCILSAYVAGTTGVK